jgi:hypothetical protein
MSDRYSSTYMLHNLLCQDSFDLKGTQEDDTEEYACVAEATESAVKASNIPI